MKALRLALAATCLVAAAPGTGRVCNHGGTGRYFSAQRPEGDGNTITLWVRIRSIEGRVVRAELEGPYARLTPDGRVRIILPDDAGCTELGPTEGPVFVIGNLSRYSSTALEIRATPALPARRPPQVRGRRDPARYDRYIVDPAYLSPEERRRREEARDD